MQTHPNHFSNDKFYPDIEQKFNQICHHINDKNKTIQEFHKILKDFCDWQMFNSKNLDKFANSVSKLIVGKDPLKDIFILFERILASKSSASEKIALNIKEDMLPFLLEQSNNLKAHILSPTKQRQSHIHEQKQKMQNKIRKLYTSEIAYRKLYEKSKEFAFSSNNYGNQKQHSRQTLEKQSLIKSDLIKAQNSLIEKINLYNHSVEEYMLSYTKLCQEMSEIETKRKDSIKESISKYIVFEMDAIKNIEYDLTRYATSIEKMADSKVLIMDRSPSEFQQHSMSTSSSSNKEKTGLINLAKISSPNSYMAHLIQSDNNRNRNRNHQQADSRSSSTSIDQYHDQNQDSNTTANFYAHSLAHKKMNDLKRILRPQSDNYELSQEVFRDVMSDINEILSQAELLNDLKSVKEIVFYTKNYFCTVSASAKGNHNTIAQSSNPFEQHEQFGSYKPPLNQQPNNPHHQHQHHHGHLPSEQPNISVNLSLLKAALCHPIFINQKFWDNYNQRLSEIVKTELSEATTTTTRNQFSSSSSPFPQSDQMKISLSFLSSDIQFMKSISTVPTVKNILKKFLKYNLGSSENVIREKSEKSSDNVIKGSNSAGNSKENIRKADGKDLPEEQYLDCDEYF